MINFLLTPKYLPLPHPMSKTTELSGKLLRNCSILGHGLQRVCEKCGAIRSQTSQTCLTYIQVGPTFFICSSFSTIIFLFYYWLCFVQCLLGQGSMYDIISKQQYFLYINQMLIIINYLIRIFADQLTTYQQWFCKMSKHKYTNLNTIATRLQQQKKSIIESFLKDYIYGNDGQFLPDIHEKQYNQNQTYQGEYDSNNKRSGTGIYQSSDRFIYLGQWQNDHYHGEGIYIFPDNQRYQGQMVKGLREGQGTFYYTDGRVYKGQWFKDKKHGYGIQEGNNIYQGNWDKDMKCGLGRAIFQDGSKYQGQFESDAPHGKGSYQNNLMRYDGQFKEGSFHGIGKITYKSGQIVEGQFQQNQVKQGKIMYPNGDIYSGSFENNQKSGHGQYKYNSGEVYIGSFKKGYKNGIGKMYFSNGDLYEGMWQNGLKHGRGSYTWSNGDLYQGGFWLDKRQGQSAIHYSSGGRYQGYWKNDKKYGQGVLFHNERATKIFNN